MVFSNKPEQKLGAKQLTCGGFPNVSHPSITSSTLLIGLQTHAHSKLSNVQRVVLVSGKRYVMRNPLIALSVTLVINSMIFLAISPNTFPPEHFCCGLGKLSSHAGRSSWKMLQTQPPNPPSPRQ